MIEGRSNETRTRILLDRGVEIDARDESGQTPLYHAAIFQRVEQVTFLVGRGADVSIPDNKRQTPLHAVQRSYALWQNHGLGPL